MSNSFFHIHSLTEAPRKRPTVLAVGSFDGVHRGHQQLLKTMVKAAQTAGMRPAVLTFFPHPKRVLQNLKGRYYLTTIEDRVALLAEQGIELVVTLPFTEEIRLTRAADFMAQLRETLDVRQLWGGDFALGYKREGTVPFLRQLGPKMGFTVQQVSGMAVWDGRLVSSSRIRAGLQAGEIADVNGCLGRPYALTGEIILGDQRGRTLGFPTANLSVWEEQLLPANGVYAAMAAVGGQTVLAATNVGTRPTVDGQAFTIEAHLIDFNGDLYGQTMRLAFLNRIRPEQKFENLDALKAQIQSDIQQIRNYQTDKLTEQQTNHATTSSIQNPQSDRDRGQPGLHRQHHH